MAEILFWSASGLLAYAWVAYPALLAVFAASKRDTLQGSGELPTVSVLVTVHNAPELLRRKIENTLGLEYPSDRLDVVVASDGSTDRTNEVARSFEGSGVRLYEHLPHEGKTAAQNGGIGICRGDVVLLTNVDTTLDWDALLAMCRRFEDPRVGCVAPGLSWDAGHDGSLSRSSGLYWRFEQLLWRKETRLGVMAWAPGAAMAVRRDLIVPMDPRYGEDVLLPLEVVSRGYRVVLETRAKARDVWSGDAAEELRARRRMTLRSFAGTLSMIRAWSPLRRPAVAWAVLSHKVLRWLSPAFLMSLLVTSALLSGHPFFRWVLAGQACFYVMAYLGYLSQRGGHSLPWAEPAFHVFVAFFAIALGVLDVALRREVRSFPSSFDGPTSSNDPHPSPAPYHRSSPTLEGR